MFLQFLHQPKHLFFRSGFVLHSNFASQQSETEEQSSFCPSSQKLGSEQIPYSTTRPKQCQLTPCPSSCLTKAAGASHWESTALFGAGISFVFRLPLSSKVTPLNVRTIALLKKALATLRKRRNPSLCETSAGIFP